MWKINTCLKKTLKNIWAHNKKLIWPKCKKVTKNADWNSKNINLAEKKFSIKNWNFWWFQLHFRLHSVCVCWSDFQMIWPVKASPWMPLEVISGLRLCIILAFHSSDLFPRFLWVENPPNPSSKIPSWNPFLPLRLGSKSPDWLSPPNQKRFNRIEESYMVTKNHQKSIIHLQTIF